MSIVLGEQPEQVSAQFSQIHKKTDPHQKGLTHI